MLGLDAAGKTTILYKLHIGEVLSTVPTIGKSFLLQENKLLTRFFFPCWVRVGVLNIWFRLLYIWDVISLYFCATNAFTFFNYGALFTRSAALICCFLPLKIRISS